jgi:hypothetical protein
MPGGVGIALAEFLSEFMERYNPNMNTLVIDSSAELTIL